MPYTPGGFTDITARLVTQKLQERLGQPVVIDNKPGANSIVGVDAAREIATGRLYVRGSDRRVCGQHHAVSEIAV